MVLMSTLMKLSVHGRIKNKPATDTPEVRGTRASPLTSSLCPSVLTGPAPLTARKQCLSVDELEARSVTLDSHCFLPTSSCPHKTCGLHFLTPLLLSPICFYLRCFFFLVAPHSMWDLRSLQGLNPSPLQWKRGVLTTGPPGKSLFALRPMQSLLTSPCCFFQFVSYKQAVLGPAKPAPAHRLTSPLLPPCTLLRGAACGSRSLQRSSLHGSALFWPWGHLSSRAHLVLPRCHLQKASYHLGSTLFSGFPQPSVTSWPNIYQAGF